MDMTKMEIKGKIITLQNEIDKIEYNPHQETRVKQLKAVRDYLYKKLGEVIKNEQENLH